jgi:alcohol dehydrogenase (nicotinoprotein)
VSAGLYRGSPRRSAPAAPGHLKLDEIITARYSLEQVNEGYRDLLAGKNLRGVILHES